MRVRIRDFVVTKEKWIFAVVCYETEEEASDVKCLLRYIPDAEGDRTRAGERFRKLDFASSYEFLRRHRPEYLRGVFQVVPKEAIEEVLRPSSVLPAVAARDERVRKIAEIFSEGGIPAEKMGITGSFLCGLQTAHSDIDFVIYGVENFKKTREIVKYAMESGELNELGEEMWRRIYKKRSPSISYDVFKAHEMRKWNRGGVGNTYFDVLFVRDWSEMGGIRDIYKRGERVCRARISAIVRDATYAFDSPAVYEVETLKGRKLRELRASAGGGSREHLKEILSVEKILSFTHTYAGQAFEGEIVEAQGVVERTSDGETRLIVGTTREAHGEWLKSLSLLGVEE